MQPSICPQKWMAYPQDLVMMESCWGVMWRPSNWWYCTQMTWRIPRWLQKLLEHPVPDRTFLTFSRFNFNQRHGWHLSLAKGSSRYSIYVLQGFSNGVAHEPKTPMFRGGITINNQVPAATANDFPCFSWGKIELWVGLLQLHNFLWEKNGTTGATMGYPALTLYQRTKWKSSGKVSAFNAPLAQQLFP